MVNQMQPRTVPQRAFAKPLISLPKKRIVYTHPPNATEHNMTYPPRAITRHAPARAHAPHTKAHPHTSLPQHSARSYRPSPPGARPPPSRRPAGPAPPPRRGRRCSIQYAAHGGDGSAAPRPQSYAVPPERTRAAGSRRYAIPRADKRRRQPQIRNLARAAAPDQPAIWRRRYARCRCAHSAPSSRPPDGPVRSRRRRPHAATAARRPGRPHWGHSPVLPCCTAGRAGVCLFLFVGSWKLL